MYDIFYLHIIHLYLFAILIYNRLIDIIHSVDVIHEFIGIRPVPPPPPGQFPPGQFPPRDNSPLGQLPPGQFPPGQLPPRTIPP